MVPYHLQYQIYPKSLFKIAEDYYGLSEENFKAVFKLEGSFAAFLEKSTFSDLNVCYGLQVSMSLEQMLGHLKYIDMLPKQVMHSKLAPLKNLSKEYVESYLKNFTFSAVHSFCPIYKQLTEKMYDPFMISAYLPFYGNVSRGDLEGAFGKLNITDLIKKGTLAVYRTDILSLILTPIQIKQKVSEYLKQVNITQNDLEKTLFEVLAGMLGIRDVVVERIFVIAGQFEAPSANVALKVKVSQIQKAMETKQVVGESAYSIFTAISIIGKRLSAAGSVPMRFLMKDYTREDILNRTLMQMAYDFSNVSEEFIISYYSLKISTLTRMKNFTLSELFREYFPKHSINKLFLLPFKVLTDDSEFKKITGGYFLERQSNLRMNALSGLRYAFTNVSIQILEKVYNTSYNETHVAPFLNTLIYHTGFSKEEISTILSKTTVSLFVTFPIALILEDPRVNDSMSLTVLDKTLDQGKGT